MNLRSTILAVLFPMAAMAAGGSAHYTLTADILDGAGSSGASAHYAHGGHLLSPAGSGASAHYSNGVGFQAQTVEDPALNIITGTNIPGLPGAKFVTASKTPSTNPGDAILTLIKLANGTKVSALVRPSGVLVKVGDTFPAAGNAQFSKLFAMSSGAFLAELKVGTGSPAATLANNKLVCFDTGTALELIARTGQLAPGTTSTFKAFQACAGSTAGDVFLVATVNAVPSADVGIWARPNGGALHLLARESQTENLGNGAKPITVIAAMPTVSKSPTEGRVLYGGTSILARFTQGKELVNVAIPATATSRADWTILARTNGAAPGGIGTYLILGLPAAEGTNVAFKATLRTAGAVTAGNNTIVVADGTIIARKGQLAPGTTATFLTFDDPAAGSASSASFTAKLAGATTASDTGLWESRANTLGLVAREGSAAPDIAGGVTIKAVTRFAHPGGHLGPVFIATLQGTGVTIANNTALYAVPAGGGPALDLARTGDQFDIGGTMRTLRIIRALDIALGTVGTARGYTDSTVFMLGSFTGGVSALLELPVTP